MGIEFAVKLISPVDSVALVPPLSPTIRLIDRVLWPRCGQISEQEKQYTRRITDALQADPLRKCEWERQHRAARLARRRELRRTDTANTMTAAQPVTPTAPNADIGSTWLPVIAGGAIAFFDPKLALGIGSLTLILAAIYKKGGSWWVAGIFTLALALFLGSGDQNPSE